MQRDARYEAIVQMLLDRQVEDREAREKRLLGYRQYLENEADRVSSDSSPCFPARLYRFRTKMPCRITTQARTLLHQFEKQFSGGSVTFQQRIDGRQAIMLTEQADREPRQIGWIEHSIETDPDFCTMRDQALAVETDGGRMLVLRFRYFATPVRICAAPEEWIADAPGVDFTEIRPALDLRPLEESASPGLVWVTRPEVETMDTLGSREYEAFYVRFKLAIQGGIWSALSSLLSHDNGSQWHRGSYYTVVREVDARNARIYQRTLDDRGTVVDVGLDRIYDASTATDILLLYLGGDLLADIADIYFTLQSLSPTNAALLKEDFFARIRRFWESTASLTAHFGNELAALLRMSQRAVPAPAQALLLKGDWTNLRQQLVDRYGEGGVNAADLTAADVDTSRDGYSAWPFAAFPPGDVNVGLRFVYRLEDDDRKEIGVRSLAATTDTDLGFGDDGDEATARPVEIQNIVLVAERLPAPEEIDLSWVARNDWILAKVLLDESFRAALGSIAGAQEQTASDAEAQQERLLAHLRENILHYQRAIWQQEDAQQRSMRYRKSGKKVPLEWHFELESGGALTIHELSERLKTRSVDGQFAAYSGGPEADLGQLIDPAQLIGYYGNYAIYPMRPEFGSEEFFSMLHFFKSPYLIPNQQTGEPEIADPSQARIPENIVMPIRDRSLEIECDRILQLVPDNCDSIIAARGVFELRSAIAQTGVNADMPIRAKREEMLNLRVAGGGDVVRPGDVQGARVTAAQDSGLHLTSGAHRRAQNEPAIVPDGKARMVCSVAGDRVPDAEAARVVVTNESATCVLVGRAHDPGSERIVTGERMLEVIACREGAQNDDAPPGWAIVAHDGGLRTPGLIAGAGTGLPDAEVEPLIVGRDVERVRPSLIAG